jgi:hypothetical protein
MIRLKSTPYSFTISFVVVLVFHLVILFFFKKDSHHQFTLSAPPTRLINKIDFISKEDLERIKRVGIKRASKNQLDRPDFMKDTRPLPTHKTFTAQQKNTGISTPSNPASQITTQVQEKTSNTTQDKVIFPSHSHEVLKQDALKSFSFNKDGMAAQKISNFEIRYERPEGVSEDELNSDEKAFYSFYKRSYASYVSKLYATYEEIAVNRPRLNKDFETKHLLVGRIDYDQNGNIIMVKIIKSSDSDDVHYFFEETLKKLVLPNPPKIFLKKKKEFSIYYQVQIN